MINEPSKLAQSLAFPMMHITCGNKYTAVVMAGNKENTALILNFIGKSCLVHRILDIIQFSANDMATVDDTITFAEMIGGSCLCFFDCSKPLTAIKLVTEYLTEARHIKTSRTQMATLIGNQHQAPIDAAQVENSDLFFIASPDALRLYDIKDKLNPVDIIYFDDVTDSQNIIDFIDKNIKD